MRKTKESRWPKEDKVICGFCIYCVTVDKVLCLLHLEPIQHLSNPTSLYTLETALRKCVKTLILKPKVRFIQVCETTHLGNQRILPQPYIYITKQTSLPFPFYRAVILTDTANDQKGSFLFIWADLAHGSQIENWN